MRLYLQWTLLDPTDWIPIDLDNSGANRRNWRNLPSRPEPTSGQLGGEDNIEGWVFDINVQGVTFGGADHYACEPVDLGLQVTFWNDDPVDWPPGTRNGQQWLFQLPTFDVSVGQINTRQTRIVWTEQPQNYQVDKVTQAILPWTDFVVPAANITRHGVWTTDAKASEHIAARTQRGWREWIGP